MYNGTYFVWLGWSADQDTTYSPMSLGFGYGTCTTATATSEKAVTLSSYAQTTNGIVAVKFSYDVGASATMKINSKTAKAIYYRGSAITSGVIKAGDIAYFIYNTYYHLIGIDRACVTFTGTDGVNAGTDGLVPAPTVSDANKYLKSDGTWATVSGGGGTSDYLDLTNKPSISGVTLNGDKSLADLGIVASTTDLTPGVSTLASGTYYFVYE